MSIAIKHFNEHIFLIQYQELTDLHTLLYVFRIVKDVAYKTRSINYIRTQLLII